jgi:hypothetical protein
VARHEPDQALVHAGRGKAEYRREKGIEEDVLAPRFDPEKARGQKREEEFGELEAVPYQGDARASINILVDAAGRGDSGSGLGANRA